MVSPSVAQLLPQGGEVEINETTAGRQVDLGVHVADDGGFIVSWRTPLDVPPAAPGISARRFGPDGQPLAGEFQVNTDPAGEYEDPRETAVAGSGAGDFVVVWTQGYIGYGDYSQLQFRRYAADGSPLGGEEEFAGGKQPAAVGDPNGSFIVVWTLGEIFGQRFAADGVPVGGPFQVNAETLHSQRLPVIARRGNGELAVAWETTLLPTDTEPESVWVRLLEADGTPLSDELQVDAWAGPDGDPALAYSSDGTLFVAWSSQGADGSSWGVFGRVWPPGGSLGPPFQVNATTAQQQRDPAVVPSGSERFTVFWRGGNSQDGSLGGIFRRDVSAAGAPFGGEIPVNSSTEGQQDFPAAASSSTGRVAVAWETEVAGGDREEVHAQRFVTEAIFADGFESGDVSAWSLSLP